MPYLKWLFAGIIGSAIGGGVWFALAAWTGKPLASFALLVGLTTGYGVQRAVHKSDRGIKPGLVAVVIAVAAVFLVKREVVITTVVVDPMLASWMESAYHNSLDEESMIARTADEISLQREAAGRPVVWPEDMTYEDAIFEEDYPPDLWAEAKGRWESFSTDEQAERRDDHEDDVIDQQAQHIRNAGSRVFRENFSPWDVVWFFLAALAAFRLPAGRLSEL